MATLPLSDIMTFDEKSGNHEDKTGWVDIAAFRINDLRTYAFPFEMAPYAGYGKRVTAAYIKTALHAVFFDLRVHSTKVAAAYTFDLEFTVQHNGMLTNKVRNTIGSNMSANDVYAVAMRWRRSVIACAAFFSAVETDREQREAARWQQLIDTIADLPNVAVSGGHFREVERRFNAAKRRRLDSPSDGEGGGAEEAGGHD